MKLSEMVARYNEMADEIGRPRRRTFGQKCEAIVALAAMEAELAARRAEPKKTAKVPRGREPAGAVGPMKADSIRARILRLLDGSRTPEEIAVEVGIETRKVAPHLTSMHKHSGIGYAYDGQRRVTALYPGGGSFQEAIRPA